MGVCGVGGGNAYATSAIRLIWHKFMLRTLCLKCCVYKHENKYKKVEEESLYSQNYNYPLICLSVTICIKMPDE